MRRVHRNGGQDREDLLHEVAFQPLLLGLAQFVGLDDRNAAVAQFVAELGPAVLLPPGQLGDPLVDRAQLLRRRQAFLAGRRHARANLSLQAGHADHVELVEVAGGDRQKAQALQQGMVVVGRLFEHALVERQPRKLAVDEPGRRIGRDFRSLGRTPQLYALWRLHDIFDLCLLLRHSDAPCLIRSLQPRHTAPIRGSSGTVVAL